MISFEFIKICARTLVYQIEKIAQLKFSLKYWFSFMSSKNAFPMFYQLSEDLEVFIADKGQRRDGV